MSCRVLYLLFTCIVYSLCGVQLGYIHTFWLPAVLCTHILVSSWVCTHILMSSCGMYTYFDVQLWYVKFLRFRFMITLLQKSKGKKTSVLKGLGRIRSNKKWNCLKSRWKSRNDSISMNTLLYTFYHQKQPRRLGLSCSLLSLHSNREYSDRKRTKRPVDMFVSNPRPLRLLFSIFKCKQFSKKVQKVCFKPLWVVNFLNLFKLHDMVDIS